MVLLRDGARIFKLTILGFEAGVQALRQGGAHPCQIWIFSGVARDTAHLVLLATILNIFILLKIYEEHFTNHLSYCTFN